MEIGLTEAIQALRGELAVANRSTTHTVSLQLTAQTADGASLYTGAEPGDAADLED